MAKPPPAPADLQVVLVEPRYSANVGSVARVCRNFGVQDLVLVGDVELTDPARIMSVHAYDLVQEADRVDTLEAALSRSDHVVGFTAITADKPQDHLRDGLFLPEAAENVRAMDGRTSLVFGREDYGLYNDELAACDVVAQLPTDPGYPSMNLSHAVAVALYEVVGRGQARARSPRSASNEEVERLLLHAEHLCQVCRYQPHRILPTVLALRRVVGRARLSSYEYHRLMGMISEALKHLDAWPVPDERWSTVSPYLEAAGEPKDGDGEDA